MSGSPGMYTVYNNSLNGVNVNLLLAKSSTSYNVVVTSYNEVCAYMKFAHIMKLSNHIMNFMHIKTIAHNIM